MVDLPDTLFELPPVPRGQPRARRVDHLILGDQFPTDSADPVRLELPRWDTAWEAKKGRNGWPKVNPKTGKVIRWRPTWDPLWGNPRSNSHWSVRAKAVRVVIAAVGVAATRAGLKPCQHLTIQLVWSPGDNRHADEDNLWRLQKVLADGLARGPRKDLPGLRLVPDDDSRWMTKLGPRVERPPVPGGLWLEVWPR